MSSVILPKTIADKQPTYPRTASTRQGEELKVSTKLLEEFENSKSPDPKAAPGPKEVQSGGDLAALVEELNRFNVIG